MSRKRHVPKYRRHPNGQAFVQINTRRRYLGKFGTPESMARYRAILIEIETKAEVLLLPAATVDITVEELIFRYLAFAKGYYVRDGKPTKEYLSMKYALRPLAELHATNLAREFGPKRLKEVRDHLITKGYARKLINSRINRIKRMFRWAVGEELVPPSLVHGLAEIAGLRKHRSGARETSPIKPVPDAWVDATLPYLQPIVADMVRVQRLCGMRSGEVCTMRPIDLTLTGDVWLYRPASHKTEETIGAKVVAIPKAAQAIISHYLNRPINSYLFSPIEAEEARSAKRRAERKSPMTPSQAARKTGGRLLRPLRARYDSVSYRRAILYAIEKAARAGETIPHWHPHQLRHAAATEVARLLDETAAQRVLGHRNLKTTEIYAAKELAQLIEITRELDRRRSG